MKAQMNNNTFGTVQQHPASAESYLRHGWRIIEIPYGSKAPTRTGWNQEGNWITSTAHLPPKFNIGLLHAFSNTMALDIDDWEQANRLLKEAGIDLSALYHANDAVTIESGRDGHGKLLYEMPFPGFTLPTKKITLGGRTILELRCGTTGGTSVQDVLPPSQHPDTGQAYRWGGSGRWDRLPGIPGDLLAFWQQALAAPERPRVESTAPADWAEIDSALKMIPPDCAREQWLHVGMGLHHEGVRVQQEVYAHQLFSAWSAGDPENPPDNYKGQQDIDIAWRSFRINLDDPVTISTLFSIAKEHGWKRPIPSAEGLFSSAELPVDLFEVCKLPTPTLNMDCVPESLATRAQEVADIVGCDPLVPVFAGLGAVCGAVDKRSRLKLADGFEVPPILWLLTVGDPADKKTPGSKPMLTILRQLEREDLPRWKKAELDFKVQKDLYAKKYTEYMEFYADELNAGGNVVEPNEPIVPVEPHKLVMLVQDITSQKLMHHGAQQPRGLLAHMDEMNGWARAMSNKRGTESPSTWIQGYEGGYARMDRVGAGTLEADPFSVAVVGNMQPAIWAEYLETLSADGLIARFLVAPLRGRMTKLSRPMPDELTSKGQFDSLLRQIYASPIQTYVLSQGANDAYRENQQWVITRQREEKMIQRDPKKTAFAFALGKSDGTVGRLAFVFHLLTEPLTSVVSEQTMRLAIRFFREYCLPALRYTYTEVAGDNDGTLDTWLMSHILATAHHESISLREIRRSARRQLEHVPGHAQRLMILDSMAMLEESGWVAQIEADPRIGQYTWMINPALKTTFADYRRQVLMIRQRVQDEITKASLDRGKETQRRLLPGYDPSWDNDDFSVLTN